MLLIRINMVLVVRVLNKYDVLIVVIIAVTVIAALLIVFKGNDELAAGLITGIIGTVLGYLTGKNSGEETARRLLMGSGGKDEKRGDDK